MLRGQSVESVHFGAFRVSDAKGKIIHIRGDVEKAIFPRSAIKAFQALPLIESGAADKFSLTAQELALCVSSHGEPTAIRYTKCRHTRCVDAGDYQTALFVSRFCCFQQRMSKLTVQFHRLLALMGLQT